MRWQIWTALLAYLLLRFMAWNNKWNHPVSRHFTPVRSILLNYFKVASVIEYCDFAREGRIRAILSSPETAGLFTFWDLPA